MKSVRLLIVCFVVMCGLCSSSAFAQTQTFTWVWDPTLLYGVMPSDPKLVTGGNFFTYNVKGHDNDKVREIETGNTRDIFDDTISFDKTINSAAEFAYVLINSGSEGVPREWQFQGYARINDTQNNQIYHDEYIFNDTSDPFRIPPVLNGSRDDPATQTLTATVIVQPSHGHLQGTVKNPQGEGIPGATVTIIAGADPSFVGLSANTDMNGNFTFIPALKAGSYTLRVEAMGYQTKEQGATSHSRCHYHSEYYIATDVATGKSVNANATRSAVL